jgi:hypothetical protein
MSGVLDRMVQRSRGQLPAIEPLVRSQQTAAAAVPLVVEESAAPTPRGRNSAASGAERALREEPAGPEHDKVRPDATRASVPARKDSRRSEAHEVASAKRAAESDRTRAAKHADQDGVRMASLERAVESRDITKESEEPNESSIEILPENVLAKAEDTTGDSIRPGANVEQWAATPDISAPRNEAGAVPSANDESGQTEIHITIGSVELRAPRVASAPPKAPPFRPRVTLDEFLKRGTGSGGWGANS